MSPFAQNQQWYQAGHTDSFYLYLFYLYLFYLYLFYLYLFYLYLFILYLFILYLFILYLFILFKKEVHPKEGEASHQLERLTLAQTNRTTREKMHINSKVSVLKRGIGAHSNDFVRVSTGAFVDGYADDHLQTDAHYGDL